MDLKAVRGMNDVLPKEGRGWLAFEAIIKKWLDRYGYHFVRTPIVEHQAVFTRAVGEATDIVEKEMYAFTDHLNNDKLVLRPEGTAALVRMILEHNLLYDGPKKLWYMGAMFRHERPQKGRYRQFHQVGVEAIGFSGPSVDAEMILMGARLWKMLSIDDVSLEINNLGQPDERSAYRRALIQYLEPFANELDDDAKRRLYNNPLRILDSKNPVVKEIVDRAPRLSDFLTSESRSHFDQVLRLLEMSGVSYRLNDRLVRGLDYYNLTVFEWVTGSLGTQSAIGGGGRYDGLVNLMGGKTSPAFGFALGVERVMALSPLFHEGEMTDRCDVYVVYQGSDGLKQAIRISESLRDAGFDVVMYTGLTDEPVSLKSQIRRADLAGAQYVCVLGEDEVNSSTISIKPLRGQGDQVVIPQESLISWFLSSDLVAQ
jgi:histidyl-tRNA synthetase